MRTRPTLFWVRWEWRIIPVLHTHQHHATVISDAGSNDCIHAIISRRSFKTNRIQLGWSKYLKQLQTKVWEIFKKVDLIYIHTTPNMLIIWGLALDKTRLFLKWLSQFFLLPDAHTDTHRCDINGVLNYFDTNRRGIYFGCSTCFPIWMLDAGKMCVKIQHRL